MVFRDLNKKLKIYLAGGWFTPEQEEEHTRIYNNIKDLFDVFNPKFAGIVSKNNSEEDKDKNTQILKGNIEAINNSDIVLVIYDYKDVGTLWEAGYAYALKKPIVYYAETLGNKPFNIMLAKTGYFVSNIKDLNILLEFELPFLNIYNMYKGELQ